MSSTSIFSVRPGPVGCDCRVSRDFGHDHLPPFVTRYAPARLVYPWPRPGSLWYPVLPEIDGVGHFGVNVPGQLSAETVQVVVTHEMHLSGQHNIVSQRPQEIGPRHLITPHRCGVVPSFAVEVVLACHETDAGGNTEWSVAVSCIKSHTFLCQAVYCGRLYKGMPVCAGETGSVFVGHDDEKIGLFLSGWFCHGFYALYGDNFYCANFRCFSCMTSWDRSWCSMQSSCAFCYDFRTKSKLLSILIRSWQC